MHAKLTIVHGEAVPRVVPLIPNQIFKLGRSSRNHVVLRDEHASRWHARVYFEDGQWFILDCQTRNGTRLNGKRIQDATALENGVEIRIGDTRWRFSHEESFEEAHTPPHPYADTTDEVKGDLSPLDKTELQALYRFVEASIQEASPPLLIALGLQIIQDTVSAAVAGFLDLDEKNPLPKIVLPNRGRVDTPLSQQLTRLVQQEKRTIWLARARNANAHSESLMGYTDAVCVPVKIDEEAFGAIHVYQNQGMLTPKQVHFCKVLAGSLAKSLSVARYQRALLARNEQLHRQQGVLEDKEKDRLIGSSQELQQLRQKIDKFALADGSNILITGETGVGKELVATALHQGSLRREGPLVIVNCAAIPEEMADRELFGNREGAYTTATRDITGFFEQADMGTLVLDEIGELSMALQTKLLRALEQKTFRPLGAEADVTSNVRVLALTNRDLEKECEEKRFRWDLFFRLNITIQVPPLREHLEDLPEICDHLLKVLANLHRWKGEPLTLSEDALSLLMDYGWPGNVRQLRSVLDHAVAMTDSHVIEPVHLGRLTRRDRKAEVGKITVKGAVDEAIRQALDKHHGVLRHAAKELGISEDTLRKKKREMEDNEDISNPGEIG